MQQTLENTEVGKLATAAIVERLARVQLVGVKNAWCRDCYLIEVTSLEPCKHKYDFFGCARYLLCPSCREAHRAVEKFISTMLGFPIVERADSRRAASYSTLCRAVVAVAGVNSSFARRLHNANPFCGTDAEFRECVLGSFRDSDFRDFKRLAVELEKQKESEFSRAVYRAVRRAMSGKDEDDDVE